IHSYYPEPEDEDVVATRTSYGEEFVSAIQRGRLLATQYHPEKSQHAGLTLLGNFLSQPA
ncbi:MAG: imidazole glycerol phosphate synthase subunit HisH, partial [Verrucomicrobiales bacterium]